MARIDRKTSGVPGQTPSVRSTLITRLNPQKSGSEKTLAKSQDLMLS